jgi:anti-anti-sigma regulatory factor
MDVKIDTKEKFHVISVLEPQLSADMAEDLSQTMTGILNNPVKNIILSLSETDQVDEKIGEVLVKLQQKFYEQSASFVICEMRKSVEEFLDKAGLLELLNTTPTQSEAWDIVQMEEIEREFLDGNGL